MMPANVGSTLLTSIDTEERTRMRQCGNDAPMTVKS